MSSDPILTDNAIPSTVPSNSKSSDSAQSGVPTQNDSQFSKITMLLCLVNILNNRNGDASMHSFPENGGNSDTTTELRNDMGSAHARTDIRFRTLADSINSILAVKQDVIATFFCTSKGFDVTLVSAQDAASSIDSDLGYDFDHGHPAELKVTSVANSATGTPVSKLPHNLRLLRGEDQWSNIIQYESVFQCAIDLPNLSLEDHAETVRSYLKFYTNLDPEERPGASKTFSHYLFATSWQKMWRRISSWQGLGFIHLLDECHDYLRVGIHEFDWSTLRMNRGDRDLAILISDADGMVDVLDGFRRLPRLDLKQSFKKAAGSTDPSVHFYTKDTAEPFHNFVIAAFAAYGKHLKDIHDIYVSYRQSLADEEGRIAQEEEAARKRRREAEKKAKRDEKVRNSRKEAADVRKQMVGKKGKQRKRPRSNGGSDREEDGNDFDKKAVEASLLEAFELASYYVRLLFLILSSSVFQTHLVLCEGDSKGNSDHLVPTYQKKSTYFRTGVNLRIVDESLVRTIEEFDPSFQPPQESQEPDELLRWVRKHVDHFFARRKLEQECTKYNLEIKMSVLTLDPVMLSPCPTWEDFEQIVKEVLQECSENTADECIQKIKEGIKKSISFGPDKESRNTVEFFQKSLNGDAQSALIVTLHCEAVLALLALYYGSSDNFTTPVQAEDSDSEVISICKELIKMPLAVSKLCCPVCWQLLRELRKDIGPEQFEVNGYHSCVFPVALPSWVPAKTYAKMIKIYQDHLHRELLTLNTPNSKPRMITHHTRMSLSNNSSGSSNQSSNRSSQLYTQGFRNLTLKTSKAGVSLRANRGAEGKEDSDSE